MWDGLASIPSLALNASDFPSASVNAEQMDSQISLIITRHAPLSVIPCLIISTDSGTII